MANDLRGAFPRWLHQRRGVAEHRVGGDHVGTIHRRRAHTLRFQIFRQQQSGQPLSDRDRFVDRPRRPVAQHHAPFGDAGKFGDQRMHASESGLLPCGRQQFAAAFEMPAIQRLEIRVEIGLIACLRLAQRIEQQVGDLRHGRNHRHDRAFLVLFRGEIRAATRIRSAEPMLVPPNFMTRSSFMFNSRVLLRTSSRSPPPPLPATAAGIDVFGVGRLHQRSFRARPVALVSFRDLLCDLADLSPDFPCPPFGSRLRIGIQENLHLRVWETPRCRCRGLPSPPIATAPIVCCSSRMARRTPGDDGHFRRRIRNSRFADSRGYVFAVQHHAVADKLDIARLGQLLQPMHVVEIDAMPRSAHSATARYIAPVSM